jgi:transcriptional regulator with XRE-family HTH domain
MQVHKEFATSQAILRMLITYVILFRMRPSPRRHNLARLRLFLNLRQPEMAKHAGCSVHTIQSVELGRLRLSEELARRISAATGVHFRWLLENDLEAEIVGSRGHPFTKSDFECVQANKKIGSSEFMQFMIKDYAASFYGQIRALLSSAVKRDLSEVAVWKLAKFLDECRNEFGHDNKLVAHKEQFGLRADASPYLKFRQIEAGIALFREYDSTREELIRKGALQDMTTAAEVARMSAACSAKEQSEKEMRSEKRNRSKIGKSR